MSTTVHDGRGRVVEQTIDHGDGTGTRTTYDANGQPVSTGALTGLPVELPGEKNRRTIEQRLADDLAAMQQIIDTPSGSLDLPAIRQAVKAIARAERRLIRHALAAYDATD